MPALPRNCYKTPHGFLFRIIVPEALRPAVGKREIKKPLGKDYREAVSQARLLSVQVDRQFSELYEKSAQLQRYLAMRIDAMHTEHILGQINSYGSNIHDGLSFSFD